MPTKKGSSKASKSKKTQAKVRRAKPSARKSASAMRGAGRAGGKRATAQRAARSTNVAIGSSPPPIERPATEPGQNKAADNAGERVRIL
jgi:hypothetical protein